MAKWLTRWSAKPVFMGSNPIRCSKFLALDEALGRINRPGAAMYWPAPSLDGTLLSQADNAVSACWSAAQGSATPLGNRQAKKCRAAV